MRSATFCPLAVAKLLDAIKIRTPLFNRYFYYSRRKTVFQVWGRPVLVVVVDGYLVQEAITSQE